MRHKRSLIGAISALILALTAGVTAGSAQAAAPLDRGDAGQVLRAPAAPAGAAVASPQGLAAVSPSVSPSATSQHVAPGGTFYCDSGNLCAAVWDPTTANWEIFHLYDCNRYYLSNWGNTGYYWNLQTGNPTSTFYGQSGNVIKTFKPFSERRQQDWNPVWSIRNC
ncbi:hypothetical protein [Streptomyces sp. NPDC002785]|uniref:hypothetical protein n=1 Tax=Streptomyces sp. NPDC002785 TaxID=3154543 RepID=UPI003325C3B3